MYKLSEILDLFQLSHNISIEDLKRAKKRVLMTHPDKSRLSPEYFLFYKKAFDMVVLFYENQQKQNKIVPSEEQKYEPININDMNKSSINKVKTVINEMNRTDFNSKFNKLFEDNMVTKNKVEHNEWFTKDEPSIQIDGNVNKQNLGIMFEKAKEKQNSSALAKYRGVENLLSSGSCSKLYDDENNDDYVQCDPFSKLKFDDLRKVHKDQTVFAVSEKDINKIKRYSSTDEYSRAREKQMVAPVTKEEGERILAQQQQDLARSIMQKEYDSKLKTMEYEQKNKVILSSFLQIKN